jgi:hypothetical protein
VKKNGKLRYYLYVTSNTSKTKFIKVEKEFKEKVKRDRDLKGLQLFCMNKPEMIHFVEFFKKNQKKFIECNKAKFLTVIRRGFTENNNYFSFKIIKKDLNELIKKSATIPSAREMRRT